MKKIKIDGYTYDVETAPELEIDGDRVDGWSSREKQLIKLDADLHPEKWEQALLHEVLHMCLEEEGFEKQSFNETLVDRLATRLYQVLKDNYPF